MEFINYAGFTILPNTSPICLRGFYTDAKDGAAVADASFVVPILAWVIQHESDGYDGGDGVRVELTPHPIALDDFPDKDSVYCYESVHGGVTMWIFPCDRAFTSLDAAVAYGVGQQREATERQHRRVEANNAARRAGAR